MMWQAAQSTAQLAPVLKKGLPAAVGGRQERRRAALHSSAVVARQTGRIPGWERGRREAKRYRSLLLGLKTSKEAEELFWGEALPGRPQRRSPEK